MRNSIFPSAISSALTIPETPGRLSCVLQPESFLSGSHCQQLLRFTGTVSPSPSTILLHQDISVFFFFLSLSASFESNNNFSYWFFRRMFNFRDKKDGLESISNLFKNGVTWTTGEHHQPFTPFLMLRLCKWHAPCPFTFYPGISGGIPGKSL